MRKNERQGFENLRRVIKVERKGSRGDKTYEETAYYISSLTESAQVFAKIIRGHWKIENQLHWVKDVIFEEDKTHIPHPKLSQREITERKNQSEHKNKHKERKKAFEKQ